MTRTRLSLLITFYVFSTSSLSAQMTMAGMAAMENSVGYLSSGTSIEPKITSEFEPMIHTTLGNWTLMFHTSVLASRRSKRARGARTNFSRRTG